MTSNATSNATQFLLSAVFVVACRWIKRNPSAFLRFVLFPFGGINVERWPRIMLVVVRLCAILGFYLFFLGAIGALFPSSAADPTPAVLYGKFMVGIVVSVFALRGSAEPILERVPSPKKLHPLSNRALNVPAVGSARPAEPAQPSLSDVEAPPVPNRAYPESPPTEEVLRVRRTYAASSIVLGLAWGALCFVFGLTGMAIFFVVLYCLVAVLRLFTKNAPVATCPFCGKMIERYNSSLLFKEPLRCPHCSEYSQFAFGLLIPVDPEAPSAVVEKPFFCSPAYANSVWPNGCVLCGAPPTRFDEAGDVRFQYRRLATPMAAFVVPHPAASVSGIPYCDRHRNAVQVVAPKEMFSWPWKYFPGYAERTAEKRKAFLLWRSLPMMRRYLEANRQAHSIVSAGYRAPNLFQRIVTTPFRGAKPLTPHPSAARDASTKPPR